MNRPAVAPAFAPLRRGERWSALPSTRFAPVLSNQRVEGNALHHQPPASIEENDVPTASFPLQKGLSSPSAWAKADARQGGVRWPARCLWLALAGIVLVPVLQADWRQDERTLAWTVAGDVVWQFNFDSHKGKPFFHPLSVAGGANLAELGPQDHPWHYGLWFSWKFINGANYWEENRQTGRSAGTTRWSAAVIETRADGSASIRLDLTYTHPSGRVDMTESRVIEVSAPATDGSYAIDWRARFTAGPEGALLDRTPLPGEPEGKTYGGYGGLSVRLGGAPLVMSLLTAEGPVTKYEHDRARPFASAVACNFTRETQDAGGIAILSHPGNTDGKAPWYLINSPTMHFACAAILAPQPLTLPPGGMLELNYRIVLRRDAWTTDALNAGYDGWLKAAGSKGVKP